MSLLFVEVYHNAALIGTVQMCSLPQIDIEFTLAGTRYKVTDVHCPLIDVSLDRSWTGTGQLYMPGTVTATVVTV